MAVASGCNHDVFVDGPVLPANMSATIEGDGGEVEFAIPSKGLVSFGFSFTDDNKEYYTYYNDQGDVIADSSPVAEIHRIVYDDGIYRQELERTDTGLLFRSFANPIGQMVRTIRIKYDYAVTDIRVTVLPGKPMEFEQVIYNSDMIVTDTSEVHSHLTEFVNDSPISKEEKLMPYVNTVQTVTVNPVSTGRWVERLAFDMEVPFYEDGIWSFRRKSDIVPGREILYYMPDRFLQVGVTVEALSWVDVFTDMAYTRADAEGIMIFRNPTLDTRVEVGFNCISQSPSGYDIRIVKKK